MQHPHGVGVGVGIGVVRPQAGARPRRPHRRRPDGETVRTSRASCCPSAVPTTRTGLRSRRIRSGSSDETPRVAVLAVAVTPTRGRHARIKQILLRVPDDLHPGLTDRARRDGRSVDALAAELLDLGAVAEEANRRGRLWPAQSLTGVAGSARSETASTPAPRHSPREPVGSGTPRRLQQPLQAERGCHNRRRMPEPARVGRPGVRGSHRGIVSRRSLRPESACSCPSRECSSSASPTRICESCSGAQRHGNRARIR